MALSEARTAVETERQATQKQPDLTVLLDGESPQMGSQSMDLDRLLLGRPGLLGV
jgi:hypothetical protein